MSRYEEIVEKLKAFRHARNWEQFHTPKNLSMGIAIEASELMQEFLWMICVAVPSVVKFPSASLHLFLAFRSSSS